VSVDSDLILAALRVPEALARLLRWQVNWEGLRRHVDSLASDPHPKTRCPPLDRYKPSKRRCPYALRWLGASSGLV